MVFIKIYHIGHYTLKKHFVKIPQQGIISYMNIYIGSDHAGFELKEKLKTYIQSLNIEVVDKGAFSLDNEDDYPDFIVPVAEAVAQDNESLGIVLGGSGEGEQISANKIDGIRAIEYYGGNLEIVKLGREHNDANILSLGARFISEDEAKEAVKIFIETAFSQDERHIRRLKEIKNEEINN
jgi:ribose 5-phosphate isomerase B